MSDPVNKQNHLDDPQVINQDEVRDRAFAIIHSQVGRMPRGDVLTGNSAELAEMLTGVDALSRGLVIREHYVCTGLGDARELLREAAAILAVFGSLEQAALGTQAPLLGDAGDASTYNQALSQLLRDPVTQRLSRGDRDQLAALRIDLDGPDDTFVRGTRQAVPQYGDATRVMADAPVEVAGRHQRMSDLGEGDYQAFADLHQRLLDTRVRGDRSVRQQLSMLPPDTARTAVARALLSAAESAVQAATTYLGQVASYDNLRAYQQMYGPAVKDGASNEGEGERDGDGPGEAGPEAAAVQSMGRLGLLTAQVWQSLAAGHITLSAAQQLGGSRDVTSPLGGERPGAQVLGQLADEQRRQTITLLPQDGLGGSDRLLQPLRARSLPEYFLRLDSNPAQQLLTLHLPPPQLMQPNFQFATHSALAVGELLRVTEGSAFETAFGQVQELHLQRQAEQRRQADARRRAQSLRLGGPKPLGHGAMVAALSGLADNPGEGGRLTISLAAQAT
ncbi:MAG: hypothetical protein AAGC55_22910, partial [Myxococcota bacterium]